MQIDQNGIWIVNYSIGEYKILKIYNNLKVFALIGKI